jgi:hypothetical protein
LRKNSKLLKEPASADQAAKAVVDRSKAHIPIGEGPQASPSNAGHVPSASQAAMTFTDPEEVALHAKFQADLWKLRAIKQGVLATSPAPDPASQQLPQAGMLDKLTMIRGPDGTIVLKQEDESTVQAESDVANSAGYKPEADIVGQPIADVGEKTKPNHDDTTLDPYAEAAIVALHTRNKKKKAEAAEKKKTEAAQKKAEAAEKEKAKAAEKQANTKKRNEGKGNMPDIKKKQAMPADTKDGSNPAPVPFLSGIIYTQQKLHKFRGLRVKGDRYTEASSTWGSKRTKAEAWRFVTDAITKHAKKT